MSVKLISVTRINSTFNYIYNNYNWRKANIASLPFTSKFPFLYLFECISVVKTFRWVLVYCVWKGIHSASSITCLLLPYPVVCEQLNAIVLRTCSYSVTLGTPTEIHNKQTSPQSNMYHVAFYRFIERWVFTTRIEFILIRLSEVGKRVKSNIKWFTLTQSENLIYYYYLQNILGYIFKHFTNYEMIRFYWRDFCVL